MKIHMNLHNLNQIYTNISLHLEFSMSKKKKKKKKKSILILGFNLIFNLLRLHTKHMIFKIIRSDTWNCYRLPRTSYHTISYNNFTFKKHFSHNGMMQPSQIWVQLVWFPVFLYECFILVLKEPLLCLAFGIAALHVDFLVVGITV